MRAAGSAKEGGGVGRAVQHARVVTRAGWAGDGQTSLRGCGVWCLAFCLSWPCRPGRAYRQGMCAIVVLRVEGWRKEQEGGVGEGCVEVGAPDISGSAHRLGACVGCYGAACSGQLLTLCVKGFAIARLVPRCCTHKCAQPSLLRVLLAEKISALASTPLVATGMHTSTSHMSDGDMGFPLFAHQSARWHTAMPRLQHLVPAAVLTLT